MKPCKLLCLLSTSFFIIYAAQGAIKREPNLFCKCHMKKLQDNSAFNVETISYFKGRAGYSSLIASNECTGFDDFKCSTYCLSNFQYVNNNLNATEKETLGREICTLFPNPMSAFVVILSANLTVYKSNGDFCFVNNSNDYNIVCEGGRAKQWPRFNCLVS